MEGFFFLNFKYTILLSLGICRIVLKAGLLMPIIKECKYCHFMVLLLLVLVSVKYGVDDGFMKKPKLLPCFGQQKMSKNAVVIDDTLFVL